MLSVSEASHLFRQHPERRTLDGGRWYPQVIGDPTERGTDKLAGRTARLYLSGISEYEVVFEG